MNHDLADPADRVGYLLWQTAHLVSLEMTAVLEPLDLTPAQFGVLVHAGREPGVSAAELARRINVRPQSVHVALQPLIGRALIERRPHPVHRRVLGNFLTPVGLEVATRAGEAVDRANGKITASLSPEAEQQFKEALLAALVTLNPAALDRSSIRSHQHKLAR